MNTRRFILLAAATLAMFAAVPFLRTTPVLRGVRYE